MTRHAERRIKERMGLGRKSAQRMAQRAYQKGEGERSFSGSLRSYLEARKANHAEKRPCMRLYGMFVWIFIKRDLVTVIDLPPPLRQKNANLFKKKKNT